MEREVAPWRAASLFIVALSCVVRGDIYAGPAAHADEVQCARVPSATFTN